MLPTMLHIGKCMQLFCLVFFFFNLYPFLYFSPNAWGFKCKTFPYSQPSLNHQHDYLYSRTSPSTPHC